MRARTPLPTAALGLALVLSLSACAADDVRAGAEPASGPTATSVDDALLAELGLDGMSGKDIVEQLESSPQERPLPLAASVREDHLLVGDGTSETSVPLPADEFYVSVAPYLQQTHECYHHSLATCRGELADEEVTVVITDDAGEVLVDETVTTGSNGFTGFWLPRGIEDGTIEVTHDGHEGTVPLATTPGSPTCVTTLQLEPADA